MANKESHESIRPKVGIGIMILKSGQVLLGKRRGSHGEGEYAFPGGHLEYMESFRDCAQREIAEECGIKVKNIRFQLLSNVMSYAPKHYVHIGLIADWQKGIPEVLEPDKLESWGWYDLDKLPKPLFEPCKTAISSYKTKKIYYDTSKPHKK